MSQENRDVLTFIRNHSRWLILASLLTTQFATQAIGSENLARDRDSVVARVGNDIKYLASDELGGRGVGTPGIEAAAKLITDEFERLGLVPGGDNGTYLQEFPVRGMGEVVASATSLTLTPPEGEPITLKIGEQFQPQLTGSGGPVSGELVFAGYGIMAVEEEFNEYADIDVKDKIVVLIRREPQQDDEESLFDGKGTSRYAYINTKLRLAGLQEAKGVIMVNDTFTSPNDEADALAAPDLFGSAGSQIPFAHMKQSVLNQILKTSPVTTPDGDKLSDLAAISDWIDENFKPLSQPLEGWSAKYQTEMRSLMAHNVIGMLEGSGDLADQTIVIGAHYDHLGNGGYGSRRPGNTDIHNGADDNATGTAAVMELARRYAAAGDKPRRRLVFIGFSAEERGLIGSQYYVDHPTVPLDKTIAMINFDMIGWLRNGELELHGAGSSEQFDALIEQAGEGTDLNLKPVKASFGGSDHLPFIGKKIPALFVHTGLTDTYHTPDDDYETLNIEGCAEVIDYTENLINVMLKSDETLTFSSPTRRRTVNRPRVLLGAQFNLGDDEDGLRVERVTEDSPAELGGLKTGDVVISMGGTEVSTRQELLAWMIKQKPDTEVKVVVKRGEETVELDITLKALER